MLADTLACVDLEHKLQGTETQVGFGHIVASEIEAPNMLANLVYSG